MWIFEVKLDEFFKAYYRMLSRWRMENGKVTRFGSTTLLSRIHLFLDDDDDDNDDGHFDLTVTERTKYSQNTLSFGDITFRTCFNVNVVVIFQIIYISRLLFLFLFFVILFPLLSLPFYILTDTIRLFACNRWCQYNPIKNAIHNSYKKSPPVSFATSIFISS